MPQVFATKNNLGIDHLIVIESYLVRRELPLDGLVARSARDNLGEIFTKLGEDEDEDILVGIALVRAIASWRALMLIGDFGDDIHKEQMYREVKQIAVFLQSQYQTKFFLGTRPRRKIIEYLEKLTPHSVIE